MFLWPGDFGTFAFLYKLRALSVRGHAIYILITRYLIVLN